MLRIYHSFQEESTKKALWLNDSFGRKPTIKEIKIYYACSLNQDVLYSITVFLDGVKLEQDVEVIEDKHYHVYNTSNVIH